MIRIATTLLIASLAIISQPVLGQTAVDISGLAFGDYYYILDSPSEATVDMNGFTIRRMYLTADFDLPNRFDGRARLEANDGNVSGRGMDAFVKDLYLRWRADSGHSFRLGVISIPHYEESSETVWNYRSLEATVLDFNNLAPSRDIGVRVDGPLLSENRLSYTLMVGNNNAQRPEVDRGKRLYAALLSRPGSNIVLGLSADYAGYTDERERGVLAHAFAGYESERFSAGIEPFWNRIDLVNGSEATTTGVSLFAHASLTDSWRVIGRVDVAEAATPAADLQTTFAVIAISYEPNPWIRFMPNLWITKVEGLDDPEMRGRFTFEFRF